MKNRDRIVLAGLAVVMSARAVHAEPAWVQVRESMVRSKPAFYSPGVVSVRYGDELEKVAVEGGWIKVRRGKGEGFLPASALSSDRIVLTARDITKVKADSADVVLAGKGFSREVEQEYKKRDTGARFDLVDRVESATKVSNQEVRDFIKTGHLKE